MSALLVAGGPALILNAVSVGMAWGLATALRLPRGQRIAIGLECGLQNFALAAFVALTLLNDAVLLLPAVAYGLTMWLSAFVVMILARRGPPIPDVPPSFNFYAAILENVRRRPDAIAVVDGDREITYAQFAKDIDRVSRRLHGLGLPERDRVAIRVIQPYLHWLVVIGLWRIRITSISVDYDIKSDLTALFGADVLISDQENASSSDLRFVRIGDAWIHDDDALLPLFDEKDFEIGHPVRIVLSSGTTGMPKKIPLTKDVIDARMFRALNNPLVSSSVRFMSLVSVASVEFFFSVAAWSAGGTVEFAKQPLLLTLNSGKLKCNFIFMNTAQLNNLVHSLPENSKPIPSLMVLVGGSILPKPIYLKAQQRLTRSVMVIYGSSEAGTVALNPDPLQICNPGVCGYVVRDMEVQIVNEAGLPVPRGVEGEIRIRGTSCVTYYLDDPETSKKTFRDGWLYPGDTGTLSKSGLMTIVGRADDVMNLESWKVAPSVIEQQLFLCRGVKDLVAFSMPNEDGAEKLWIAVVRGEGYSQDDIAATWVNKFGAIVQLNIIYVDAIPHNAMGKALRNDLRAMTKARLLSQADVAPEKSMGSL
jgi:acyl-coenzyme A synthetase/AMP-(fatty) acid ligase